MRCSLLNQFEGAFLGANLGMVRSSHHQQSPAIAGEQPLEQRLPLLPLCQPWSKALIGGQFPLSFGSRDLLSGTPVTQSVAALGCTLPLALFYHEQPQQLLQQLQAILKPSVSEDLIPAIALVPAAISLMLRQPCLSDQWIPELLASLNAPSTGLIKVMIQAQSLQAEFASLERAKEMIGSAKSTVEAAIALGFYVHLSSRDDFRLTLQRAKHASAHPPLTAMVAGALAGAYNGMAGIPVEWRSPAEEKLLSLAQHLLAAWSGVDALCQPYPPNLPVSAPGVMRPR